MWKTCSFSFAMKLLSDSLASDQHFHLIFQYLKAVWSLLYWQVKYLKECSKFCNGTAKDTYHHLPPILTTYGPDKTCGIPRLPTRLPFWSHILINQLPNFHVELNLYGMLVSEHCDPPLCFLRETGCLHTNTQSQGTLQFSKGLSFHRKPNIPINSLMLKYFNFLFKSIYTP